MSMPGGVCQCTLCTWRRWRVLGRGRGKFQRQCQKIQGRRRGQTHGPRSPYDTSHRKRIPPPPALQKPRQVQRRTRSAAAFFHRRQRSLNTTRTVTQQRTSHLTVSCKDRTASVGAPNLSALNAVALVSSSGGLMRRPGCVCVPSRSGKIVNLDTRLAGRRGRRRLATLCSGPLPTSRAGSPSGVRV